MRLNFFNLGCSGEARHETRSEGSVAGGSSYDAEKLQISRKEADKVVIPIAEDT